MTAAMASTNVVDAVKSFSLSGSAAVFAEFVTIPLDTAKVRLQLQNKTGSAPIHSGSISVIRDIWKSEGIPALFKGIEAGAHRQLIFTGLRVGGYGKVLDAITDGKPRKDAHIIERAQAAAITSAVGITIANPSDVVKVRTQAMAAGIQTSTSQGAGATGTAAGQGVQKSSAKFSPESRRQYCSHSSPVTDKHKLYKGSAIGVYRDIIRTEGFLGGLYAGYFPNLVRNTIISACEIVTYDVAKNTYKDLGVPDGPGLHMLAGVSAGLVATTLGSPMDVVSTRIMVNKQKGHTSGMVDTCRQMLLKEGVGSFYQGFTPNFLRIG